MLGSLERGESLMQWTMSVIPTCGVPLCETDSVDHFVGFATVSNSVNREWSRRRSKPNVNPHRVRYRNAQNGVESGEMANQFSSVSGTRADANLITLDNRGNLSSQQEVTYHIAADRSSGGEGWRVIELEVDPAVDAAAASFIGGLGETIEGARHDLLVR